MTIKLVGLAVAAAMVSTGILAQEALEPIPGSALRENAAYYNQREVAVSGYVVDSHTEWYGDTAGDYMTWNLLISDVPRPEASNYVLLCYESGLNIDRIREAAEIANIQKDMERQVTVFGEYDGTKDILNLRKLMYYEDGEPVELDTDVGDGEHVRIYRQYARDFDYDVHYSVWFNYSFIWPHPHWWVCWESIYIVRPPAYYITYYTPWRLYRHRIHPVRVPPVSHIHHVVRGDGDRVVRVNPRGGRERIGQTPIRHSTRGDTERTRVTPQTRPDTGREIRTRTDAPERVRVAPETRDETRTRPPEVRQPVRVAPERSSPPVRTEPPERTRVMPETRTSPRAEVRAPEIPRHEIRMSAPTPTAPISREVSSAPVRVAPDRGSSVSNHASSGRERPAELRRH